MSHPDRETAGNENGRSLLKDSRRTPEPPGRRAGELGERGELAAAPGGASSLRVQAEEQRWIHLQ